MPRDSLAQQASKVARIGYLYFGSRQSSLDTGRYNAFVQGMRELGYVEGTNFTIEARFADGKTESLPALAGELVRLKVDVIVATGTPVLRALQHTITIPVVSTVTTATALPRAWRGPAGTSPACRSAPPTSAQNYSSC